MHEEEVEILKTKINSSVLYELGGMYTSVSQTLREFVQNSFDSCANNVDINVDIINDIIIVSDDGIGMNDYIVRNHYKDVGFSSKKQNLGNIDENKMPTVPSELVHNLKRPKIGSKGMGKLSWILIASEMITITTTIDMDNAIKIEFSSNDLENNKLSYISKSGIGSGIGSGHGTTLILKGLRIKDFGRYNRSGKNSGKDFSSSSSDHSSNDVEELINTIGFLGLAFPDFKIYLSVNSHTDRITKQLITKKLYSGKAILVKDSGVFKYGREKGKSKEIPYDFLLIIPDHNSNSSSSSSSSSEFWLLSQYMGVKKLDWVTRLSGYLNIDNVKLVANRNDLQSSENEMHKELKDRICDILVGQLVSIYRSDSNNSDSNNSDSNNSDSNNSDSNNSDSNNSDSNNSDSNNSYSNSDVGGEIKRKKISILDQNQNSLLEFVYNFSSTYRQLKVIAPFLKFRFYLDGEHRLKDFESNENTIYYYFDNNIGIADKVSYCGFKCFEVMNEGIIVNTLTSGYPISGYIQNIEKLPKDAYESVGSSVTPIGGLKDVLGNLGPIFESLAFAIIKIESNISKMKNELKRKKFSDVQRKERLKEIAKLETYLLNLKNGTMTRETGTGVSSNVYSGTGSIVSNNLDIGERVDKSRDALKLSKEHYIKYNILDREYLIGFASLEDEETIANIVGKRYITFNLKNDYIKDSLAEKNPIRQIIMLLPLICHEICHEWSSTHDEVFQMMFNALLIPSLDCLTRQIFEGDLIVKNVEEISINDKGEKKEKGFYDDKARCSICKILLAKPETIKTGICIDCSKKIKKRS